MPGKTYMLHIDNMRYETNKYYLNFRRNPLVVLNKINCCKCILRSVHITFFCKSSKRLREYSCNTISEQKVQIKNLVTEERSFCIPYIGRELAWQNTIQYQPRLDLLLQTRSVLPQMCSDVQLSISLEQNCLLKYENLCNYSNKIKVHICVFLNLDKILNNIPTSLFETSITLSYNCYFISRSIW